MEPGTSCSISLQPDTSQAVCCAECYQSREVGGCRGEGGGKGRVSKEEEVQQPQLRTTPTWYFPLAPRSVPSLSQVTMGLGFPKAVQVMVTLPPSLASMYWGGVSVKVGGAAERAGWG